MGLGIGILGGALGLFGAGLQYEEARQSRARSDRFAGLAEQELESRGLYQIPESVRQNIVASEEALQSADEIYARAQQRAETGLTALEERRSRDALQEQFSLGLSAARDAGVRDISFLQSQYDTGLGNLALQRREAQRQGEQQQLQAGQYAATLRRHLAQDRLALAQQEATAFDLNVLQPSQQRFGIYASAAGAQSQLAQAQQTAATSGLFNLGGSLLSASLLTGNTNIQNT